MKQSLPALVVDEDPQIRSFISAILETDLWNVREAENASQAFKMLAENLWTLVFCDVTLDDTDGYQVLRRFREEQPEAQFILMTRHGSAAGALKATATGAYDYLIKPFSVDNVLKIAKNVRTQFLARSQNKITDSSSFNYKSDNVLVGRSPKFIENLKMVGRVSATTLPVLITGESGTGKEVIARSIHSHSKQSGGSFVTVNCGAIPAELIESELFGHARGAFTGADYERRGLWEEADGGTIFLDEITETSPSFQVKLLRALQEGEIRRVGSNRTKKVHVRVIAATNRHIEEEVSEGRFRQDLMYRLNAITIDLPPLRERIEDIPLLADYFAGRARSPYKQPVTFSRAALEKLKSYNWLGNIRELENAVLYAISLCEDTIYPEHLPARILCFSETSSQPSSAPASLADPDDNWLSLAELETKYVATVLAHTGGNKQAAARLLKIDRKTLSRIVNRSEMEK